MTDIKKPVIPDSLIYEMDEGQPIYYRGYKEVLNKTKTAEQIMGSSVLQSLLTMLIMDFLKEQLPKKYLRLSSELGFKFKKKSWRSLDIAVYNLELVKDKSIFLKNKYIQVPPLLTIEIDTKANLADVPDPSSYFQKKTDQLLTHGVSKVIWIFTSTKKVMVAEKDTPWLLDSWEENVLVLEDIELNVAQLINKFEGN